MNTPDQRAAGFALALVISGVLWFLIGFVVVRLAGL